MSANKFLDRLSTHLKNTLARAISMATAREHGEVGPAHLFLALLDEPGAVAGEILAKFKIESKFLLELLNKQPKQREAKADAGNLAMIAILSQSAKQALEKAMLAAYEREHNYIGTEHLLYGMVSQSDEETKTILHHFKISPKEIISQIETVLENTSHFPALDDIASSLDKIESMIDKTALLAESDNQNTLKKHSSKKNKQPTAQDIFTIELTDPKRQKKFDPVIGREKEIERVINILCRRNKNNPVLVGEPGVGKTAIVEGLAKKISAGEVPDILRHKKIYSLDLTLLISGTIYRGEFEARLKQLIDEFSHRTDSILFIDELHNIIGAGSNQGTMDAANILKPALARGELRCIGATTIDEYKKYITNDPALERRFQAVPVNEPTLEDTVKILHGIAQNYEEYHDIKLSDEALQAAAELSSKYIHDYFLPDKAIDLIDEAAAAAKVKRKADPTEEKIWQLTQDRRECQEKKETAIAAEAFEEAMKWKEKEEALGKTIAKLSIKKANTKTVVKKITIGRADIANVLAAKLQIEPEIILTDEWQKISSLPERLGQKIVGQTQAVEAIARTLKSGHLRLNGANHGPYASFLFVGPSGVGKTALAKVLATELYFDDRALIKLDMSEFAESHGVSKLLGSPAGYVGYKERNRFLDSVRARPYSIVLFDEFDKAHTDVRKLLWQILDEGELTDSAGKKTSFRHSIIILTSNVGAEYFKSNGIGFDQNETGDILSTERRNSIITKLKEEFGSALIGRIKDVCIFNPLSLKHLEKIVLNRITTMGNELFHSRKISISPDEGFIRSLAKETFDEEIGARNAEQLTEKILNDLIIEKISSGNAHQKEFKLTKEKEYKLV